ncbi:MAG TPA: tetratricopeptide repeat protein [Thermoanaerobaculia bacterium]|nr:tetratricopeptide repeat protein [Thermoanaerobaculia bacterium]
MRHLKLSWAASILLSCSSLLAAACGGHGGSASSAAEIAFGVDMARRGLWSEALFRFHAAERADPGNPRVQNNLGVAYEAQGNFDQALEHYKKALQLSPQNKEMRANYARFVEFYQGFRSADKGKGKPKFPFKAGDTSTPPGTAPADKGQPKGPPAAPTPPGAPVGVPEPGKAPQSPPQPLPGQLPSPPTGPPPDQPPPPAQPPPPGSSSWS